MQLVSLHVLHSSSATSAPRAQTAGEGKGALESDWEQISLRESRVSLFWGNDACGTSLISIIWREYDADVGYISRAYRPLKLGRDASSRCVVNTDDESLSRISLVRERVGGHRNGTSCVSHTSPHAIGDVDCAVPGLQDLIATSSANFPKSGYANRVFAIAAINVQLAANPKALAANSWYAQ